LSSYLKDITGTDGGELNGKRVALCITASASITEAPRIARKLMRHGAEVICVLTKEAAELVSPMIFEWSTGNEPITKLTGKVEHVKLVTSRDRVDVILIAPCTANTLSKIAAGIADDPVSTLACTALGTDIPVIIVPAMHEPMVRNPVIQESISKLEKLGVKFVSGRLEESKSKIAGEEEILGAVLNLFQQSTSLGTELKSKGFLITAGPTREAIDQVRFITNASSGKMGVELARACINAGAKVVCLINGPGVVLPSDLEGKLIVKSIVSTDDMMNAVLSELSSGKYDVFISAGAPADYAPSISSDKKISTQDNTKIAIQLTATKKIIKIAKEKFPDTFVVAFKAEYGLRREDLIKRARESLEKSGADVVVANDVGRKDIGFGSEDNEVVIVSKEGREPVFLKKASKAEIAKGILDFVESRELVNF
jgi:phosphopantothenoylcysteine decarboxylase / phosphopantothenate---cysteine ligase